MNGPDRMVITVALWRRAPGRRSPAAALLLLVVTLFLSAVPASAGGHLRQVSTDTTSNTAAQHATQVEPDTFAYGRTVVAVFQSGRIVDGGSANIGYAVSHNGGATWTNGFLPSLTVDARPSGRFARASDPSVTYDAAHRTWLVSSLLLDGAPRGVGIAVSRSADDGEHWSVPTVIDAGTANWDKNWIVCDNSPTSRFYGRCYSTWDDFGSVDLLLSATSTDGGATWSSPVPTAGNGRGWGVQPVVGPDGTVVVAALSLLSDAIVAYRSTDGGATWSRAEKIFDVHFHAEAGGLRSDALPSAEVDGAGRIYLAWADCRFRAGCSSNDIVVSSSLDGIGWSEPARVPLDPASSSVDHFIPGLAVDAQTSGATTHLALSYYFYPDANCTLVTCKLSVGFTSSSDAGRTWVPPITLNPAPMSLQWLAKTTQGLMVGDYISTSFSNGRAVPVFALAQPPDDHFREAMFSAVLHVGRGSNKVTERGRGQGSQEAIRSGPRSAR